MEGAPSEKTNSEFTEFSDNYLQALFDVCKQQVRQEWKGRVRTRDLLAIYSAGGHGRKLAFDDDYDLIILLNSEDPEIRSYCGRIITRMNREIIRRGTMPQYRFADHFGDYVTTLSQLGTLFSGSDENVFIEMSQVAGARKIVGSKYFEEDLRKRIIRPFILARSDEFVRQLAGEIRSRHQAVDQGLVSAMDVKETKGGLRDVELLLTILMMRCSITHPMTQELVDQLSERLPEMEGDLHLLFDAFKYLKRRRDLYRLTVAAEDTILADQTGHMARILGYCEDPEEPVGQQRLIEEMRTTTADNAEIVVATLRDLGLW
jgi:UTP:GlnB (protein PII) uridylyltransferase